MFIAIDPAAFTPIEEFKTRIDRLIDYAKASRKKPGVEEIFVPGEIERRTMEKRLKEGIPVDAPDWQALSKTARDLGLDPEKAVQ
jgi:LDH2 family malate/lactate/ureidoglycolate dehydrogenase